MIHKISLCAFLLCIFLSLVACNSDVHSSSESLSTQRTEAMVDVDNSILEHDNSSKKHWGKWQKKMPYFGSLECEIVDAWITDDVNELGVGNFHPLDSSLSIAGDPEPTEVYYPDFIQADGQLIEGAFVLVLDLSVKNIDASNETFDAEGNKEAWCGDPYLFSAYNLIYLKDISKNDTSIWPADFYSCLNSCQQNEYAFYLEPESNITLRLGFLLEHDLKNELSSIIATTNYDQYPDGVWFDLDLS